MNKAAQIRSQIQALYPGASVLARGKNFIKHLHPSDANWSILDMSLSALHFGPQLDQEIDTAWVTADPGDSPYIRAMYPADYTALFGNGSLSFATAFPFRYRSPASGDFLGWQANPNLQWTNDLNSVSNIGQTKQAIIAQITDDTLFFPGVYGTGFDFTVQLGGTKLLKKLVITNTLATPPQSILDGGNPVLMLSFQFQRSAGVTIWIDGVQWAEGTGQQNAVSTTGSVEMRDSLGNTLWYLPAAWAVDADGNHPPSVLTRVRRSGPSFFIEYRLAWSWLQTAAYPLTLDPTIDIDVTASANDADELNNGSGFTAVATTVEARTSINAALIKNGGLVFDPAGSGPANGATITSCYVKGTFTTTARDSPHCDVYFNDVDDANDFTAEADVTSRALTALFVAWDVDNAGTVEVNTPSLVTVAQEWVDRPGVTANSKMCALLRGRSAADPAERATIHSYDGSAANAAGIHLEWTTPAGANIPEIIHHLRQQGIA